MAGGEVIPLELLPHTVQVRPKLGESSRGDLFGDQFELPCMAQGGARMVRSSDGTEVVSTLTLWAQPDQVVPVGSEVDHAGDTTTVLQSILHDAPGLPVPEHLEVICE